MALIQGNSHAPIHIFLNNLERNITSKSNIILVTNPKLDLAKQITLAEEQDKILVFVLTPENEPSLGGKIDHIGGLCGWRQKSTSFEICFRNVKRRQNTFCNSI